MRYKLGLVVGRFQIFHKGHEEIINRALELCDKVLIFVGSADKERTTDNPFTYVEREKLLREVYNNDNVIIAPLNDIGVGNCLIWGDYVLGSACKVAGMPDCMVYGEESKYYRWFSKETQKTLHLESIDKLNVDIDATRLRNAIINNDKDLFLKYTNESIHKYYDELRNILIKIK